MELRAGYKRTEVGVIPEDWDAPLLDSIAKRGSGHTPDKGHPEYWNGPIKWVSLKDSDVLDQVYIEETAATISAAGIANSSAVVHPAGTVVLSRDAGVGKSAITKTSMAVSQHFMAWQCGSRLDNHFLYYWLQSSKPEFERIAMGNTIKTIGLPFFRSYRVPQPPIGEQVAIATALSDVDALLAKIDQLIAKKRDLKQAAMQQLLTGQTRLPGFSGEWDHQSIEQLEQRNFLRLGRGKVISKQDINRLPGENPIYSSSVHNEGLFGKYGDFMFDEEMITWSVDGGGHFFYRPKHKFSVTNVCGYMRVETAVMSYRFLALQLQFMHGSMKFDYSSKAHPSVIRKAYIVPFPPLYEQTAIATVLSDMDAELAALETRRDKTRSIKQGMMQALLTGRIRLPAGK